ncbi:MAG: hypothetical protein ACXV0U_07990 [Kineosporiaceae bacterium]
MLSPWRTAGARGYMTIMPAVEVTTLTHPRDVGAVRRARNSRRLGLTVLAAIVLAGLVGLFGIRHATVSRSADGYTLSVRHAQVTRAGIAAPFQVRVHHAGGFARPLTLVLSRTLLERFDFQNFYPNPSKETASDQYVYYDFDPPPGDDFQLNLDARTAPDQRGSTAVYWTALVIDDRPVTGVEFRMWVAP